jgi:hypothetical protein
LVLFRFIDPSPERYRNFVSAEELVQQNQREAVAL